MNNAEYKLLQRELMEAFSIGDFDAFLDDSLSIDREMIIGQGNKPTIVAAVMAEAKKSGWLPKLLFHAQQRRPQNATLKALLNLSVAAPTVKRWPKWYAPTTNFHTCFIGDGLLFIDRDAIRQLLEDVVNNQADSVILVDGESQSGKSYTAEYLKFMRELSGGFNLGYVDFERWSPRQAKPEDVVREALVDDEAGSLVFDTFALAARQNISIAERLLKALQSTPEPWIFAFDHLTKTTLRQETEDFVKELVAQNLARTDTRLHLLVLGRPPYVSQIAPIKLDLHLQRTELEDYFNELIKGRSEEATPDGLKYLVDQTRTKLGGTLARPLTEVAEAVRSTYEMVF